MCSPGSGGSEASPMEEEGVHESEEVSADDVEKKIEGISICDVVEGVCVCVFNIDTTKSENEEED